ncbi:hypothetical protein GUITHDRAFT_150450 [Guillardia theta CCMP2712]|uniref:Uncharacterized protein n=1 Tax=Guillardia theta (strain CCMP2712) TaxID=905079 RepID=L1JWY6_GUITC|nr:hypothetical protein GUITHDRAFT_150450 [Guillardia theta CCMP2712]EKX52829.1 hypothetical protein GUITHDRAFT_150450 [Guillardia theta CCMP2712]|eukprot:XP_005839809.1 hypothetical protein GUITHDRAFT_150450 [Guillardia theta CCMP2712]
MTDQHLFIGLEAFALLTPPLVQRHVLILHDALTTDKFLTYFIDLASSSLWH